jgi:alpha-1,2-mannosyltransferase
MTSNDANGFAPANRPSLRRDDAVSKAHLPAELEPRDSLDQDERAPGWTRIEHGWWLGLGGAMLVFSAFPIANLFLGYATKDYGLWYQVGVAVRQGLDIYPRPETHRLFPFMYPPAAAAMLAWVSLLGPVGSLLTLVLMNSVSWAVCIWLSVWLAAGARGRRHSLVLIVPSLSVIVLVYNIYLLGQPNLALLALLLGSFACLRLGRPIAAGSLLATAAAIKAFPILVIGYLIYRRMWAASAATVVVLAAWLLLAPLAFRTPAQAIDDLDVWSKGMLFTYNTNGMAQRPFRSYSYKNQSIMALSHRLLRDMPADGETVLSKRARSRLAITRPLKGLPPLDPATDLPTFLKPHVITDGTKNGSSGTENVPAANGDQPGPTERPSRWEDSLQGAESDLRTAWRVNIADLSFRAVTAVTLAAMLVVSLFVAAAFPPKKRMTPQTDALEYALVTLLTVMFSPLSFNYAYVWLMYPTTLALHLVTSDSRSARWHRLKIAWITAVILIPALAIPMPLQAQAYGNLFVPALLLVFGLGMMLYREGRRNDRSSDGIATTLPLRECQGVPHSSAFVVRS